jgi:hypothetical protein
MSEPRDQPGQDDEAARQLQAAEANSDQHLASMTGPQLASVILITTILQQLSPIDRYIVETQIQLESSTREIRDGAPPNAEDREALAQWEARVRAADQRTKGLTP